MRTIAQYTVDELTFELNHEPISGLYVGQVWNKSDKKLISQKVNKDMLPLVNWSTTVLPVYHRNDAVVGPLDNRFWDCECDDNYIHYRTSFPVCDKCGTEQDDQPDSRILEVILQTNVVD